MPRAGDVTLSVRVTGRKAGYEALSRESTAVSVAPGAILGLVPRLTGFAAAGSKLVAVSLVLTPGTSVAYQWLRGGEPIAGATSKSYTVRAADRGTALAVRVTATKAGYATWSKTSPSKSVKR